MLSGLSPLSSSESEALPLQEYLVAHGKNSGFGRFTSELSSLKRGERVVVQSQRGLELGMVLCRATPGHLQLLANTPAGRLLRRATAEDDRTSRSLQIKSRRVFDESRAVAASLNLSIEILDVEILFDNASAIVQFLGQETEKTTKLLQSLRESHGLAVMLENLAPPAPIGGPEDGGCGKPDCGRTGGGACTTCGTGGGCSSCVSHKIDMTAYFAHLRSKLERRVPLL